MATIAQLAMRRLYKRVRDVITELQKSVPASDDPDVTELRQHLYRARCSAERLMRK